MMNKLSLALTAYLVLSLAGMVLALVLGSSVSVAFLQLGVFAFAVFLTPVTLVSLSRRKKPEADGNTPISDKQTRSLLKNLDIGGEVKHEVKHTVTEDPLEAIFTERGE